MSEPDFGPPPPSDFTAIPSDEEVGFFRENGFLAVERITTDEEIAWLTQIYDHIFDGAGVLERSGVRVDPELKGRLNQFFNPEIRFPQLLASTYVRNAKRYAAALLGVEPSALTTWGHMIRKAPGARDVPPHQDIAFWPPDWDYRAVNVWLPLHDCSVEMGTMQFRPGSHIEGCRPHHHYDDPRENLLTLDDADVLAPPAVCELVKGGCTFHDPATVHQTNPNATDQPRLAFPLTVQTEPIRRDSRRPMPWYEEFVAANGGIRQASYVADAKVVPFPA